LNAWKTFAVAELLVDGEEASTAFLPQMTSAASPGAVGAGAAHLTETNTGGSEGVGFAIASVVWAGALVAVGVKNAYLAVIWLQNELGSRLLAHYIITTMPCTPVLAH
jgi:hypothetical protein